MAIDEAILEAVGQDLVPPTLRFYSFNPPAISIGYSQTLQISEIESIQKSGFELVRRPTGGRAVLHLGDLTYSFSGRVAKAMTDNNDTQVKDVSSNAERSGGFLSRSVNGAYKQICQGLILGFRKLAVELELGSSNRDYRASYDCFMATTPADLHYKGRKLVGSAQVRRGEALLQHGSILLNQEQAKMSSVFGQPVSDAERHANLFEIIDETSTSEIEAALRSGFEEAFGCKFEPSDLTESERSFAARSCK